MFGPSAGHRYHLHARGVGSAAPPESWALHIQHDVVRYVALTGRLASTLQHYRHLRSARVLCQDDGRPLTRQSAWGRVRRAARRADVATGVHILRHTFCSHLVMDGAAGRAIQELVGHQDLTMTQRYMHLSPTAIDGTIRLLERGRSALPDGDIIVETAAPAGRKESG